MTTYLVIITTVFVLTQIIRVAQNAINLSQNNRFEEDNKEVMSLYREMALDVKIIQERTGVKNE